MAKILLLDDDPLTQKLVSRVFAKAGHETLTASSTREAWDRIHEHVLVDMLILDNQIGTEWGWQILRTVRHHPAYRGIPVVVYTAHTERESLLRYMEMGVQAVRVKPLDADVILAELKKALETDWTRQVMEPTDALCARLGISRQEYGALLAAASRVIADNLKVIRTHLTATNPTQLFNAFGAILQQCRGIGIVVAESVIASVRRHIGEEKYAEAIEDLRTVDAFLGLIRQRMLTIMDMNGAVARTALKLAPAADEPAVPFAAAGSLAAAEARLLAGQPLWQYGRHFQRLRQRPLLTPEELAALTSRVVAEPAMAAVAEALQLIRDIPDLGVAKVAELAQATRGFVPTYEFILSRVSGSQQWLRDDDALQKAIAQQDLAKVVTLVTLARIANARPKQGAINLRPIYVHTFATTLTAFECGRMLQLDKGYLLSAAGLAHDLGRWLFSLGEPGLYALALAMTEDPEVSLAAAEAALFGADHHAAGRNLLQLLGQTPLLQSVAGQHHAPAGVAETDHIISVSVVHLAHLLAHAANAGSPEAVKQARAPLRAPEYPVWALLKQRGVKLPMEAPELVDTLAEIAHTSLWIAHQFLGKTQ